MIQSDPHTSALRAGAPTQFHALAIFAAVLAALCLAWAGVEVRRLDGVPVWLKPLKFSLSFVVFFGTLALIEPRLSAQVRDGRPVRILGWIAAAAFLSEMAYLFYQAGRAEASHFNLSTPFHQLMYTAMGVGAVALVGVAAAFGWIVRTDTGARLAPALREAIWLGGLSTFGLTLIVAGYMSSGPGHFVGVHPAGAPTLPLFGWSGVTGDLRPAHFASIHAMQALPLLALWLGRGGRMASIATLRLATLGYAAVTLALFAQALLGLPLVRLG